MRLKEIYLKEGTGDVHSFVIDKWEMPPPRGFEIDPFNVLVKYHGDAEEVQILSLTADESVKMRAADSPSMDKLKDVEQLHLLVVGKPGKGTLSRVLGEFPDAVVLKGDSLENGTKGALQIFNFIEDHADSDVIIDVDNSTALKDIHQVVVIKALLSEGILSFHVMGQERVIEFHGRLIIVCHDLHQIDDSIERRVMKLDLTKDQTFPRGTALQDIPGWDANDMAFFEEQAKSNFGTS